VRFSDKLVHNSRLPFVDADFGIICESIKPFSAYHIFTNICFFLLSKAPCSFVTSLLFTNDMQRQKIILMHICCQVSTLSPYFYFLSAPKSMRNIAVQSILEFLAHLVLLVVVMKSDVSVFDE